MVEVKVTDESGCSVHDSVQIEVSQPDFEVSYEHHPKVCIGEKGPIAIPVKVVGNEDYRIDWMQEGPEQQLNTKGKGYYLGDGSKLLKDQLLKLIITDSKGCKVEDYLFLEVQDKSKCK